MAMLRMSVRATVSVLSLGGASSVAAMRVRRPTPTGQLPCCWAPACAQDPWWMDGWMRGGGGGPINVGQDARLTAGGHLVLIQPRPPVIQSDLIRPTATTPLAGIGISSQPAPQSHPCAHHTRPNSPGRGRRCRLSSGWPWAPCWGGRTPLPRWPIGPPARVAGCA